MRTLITGGIKSGKSSYALTLSHGFESPRTFLATAVAFDEHMADKIRRHQAERGPEFATIEEPIEIDQFQKENMVMDCVTMWINNLIYHKRQSEMMTKLDRFLQGLGTNAVIVTNEVGLGNIPMDRVTREYNELLAAANKHIALRMDQVILMVAGLPLVVGRAGSRDL